MKSLAKMIDTFCTNYYYNSRTAPHAYTNYACVDFIKLIAQLTGISVSTVIRLRSSSTYNKNRK